MAELLRLARVLAVPAVALTIDLCWGEPPLPWHPVVWMGRVIGALEGRAPADDAAPAARLLYGAAVVGASVALFVLPAWLLERAASRAGWPGVILLGALLKPAFAAGELFRATAQVGAALEGDDREEARRGLRSLVSRDTATLSSSLMAAAAIESLAENSSDSVVAPLFYYGLWGLPGAVAYRVVNTLDAMIGYRTPRYGQLGKTAARLDDLANLIPARLTGVLFVLAAPLAGGSAGASWRVLRRDNGRTASPNAGWPMAAAAGALGVTLEKVDHYRLNGPGRAPAAGDVRRSIDLTRWALVLGLPILVALLSRAMPSRMLQSRVMPSRTSRTSRTSQTSQTRKGW